MSRSTATQSVQASASCVPGTPTTSSSFAIGYGVSGVATITNGGAGPAVACDFVLEKSNDGGTTWFEDSRQTAGVTASTTYRFPFGFGPGGRSGDWTHYRTKFTGNTSVSVTVQADACSTTAY